jgi:CheY-like chemotaxis protein
VRPVGCSHDALALIDAGTHFDLIVTDISMPVMSGIEFVEILRKANPDLPVLFVTGYISNRAGLNLLLDEHTKVLAKPYSIQMLHAKIEGMLR